MAKNIMQFRYYGDNQNQNYPLTPTKISRANLSSGNIFSNYYPITQLGIQALPGTKFYLNNGLTPIIIGATGIYELDLEGLTQINQIKFDPKSLALIDPNTNHAYLIVDIVYGE